MGTLTEPNDVLYRIKRGLSGYVSYLAACEMNESFSEYILYEPMLRILSARGFAVECEVECPGVAQPRTGDRKRLDFVAVGHDTRFAIEVKWAGSAKLNVGNDHEKLKAFVASCATHTDRAFLCIFGRESRIEALDDLKSNGFTERGKAVVASFGVTRFGCRIFELIHQSPNKALQPTSRSSRLAKTQHQPRAARG